jgi:hypothetical protein
VYAPILHNGCREEKEKKKGAAAVAAGASTLSFSFVGGGYDRTCSNDGGLLRLQATTQA